MRRFKDRGMSELVGGDQKGVASRLGSFIYRTNGFVRSRDSLHCSIVHTSVTNHIRWSLNIINCRLSRA